VRPQTPTSTALGKRPFVPASSGSQPPTAKAPRLDPDALITSLKESAAALIKIGGEALSDHHRQDLADVSMMCYSLRAAQKAERKRISQRPVDEVMLLRTADVAGDGTPILRPHELAPEMREGIVAFLTPKQMGRVACVSRAWQVAVLADSHSRVRALQLEVSRKPTQQVLTTELLARLEDQMARAPALLKRLSDEDTEKLRDFEGCVIVRHIDLLEPHLRSFSDNGWNVLSSSPPSTTLREWLGARVDLIIGCTNASDWNVAIYGAMHLADLPPAVIEARASDILPALRSPEAELRGTVLEVLQNLPRKTLAQLPGLRALLAPLLGSQQRCILTRAFEGELARKIDYLASHP